jgi:phage head maturation protease
VTVRTFERALPIALEATGRVVEGVVLTYDRAYRVSDDGGASFYHEGWRPGAFTDGLRATGNLHELRLGHEDVRAGRVAFADSARTMAFAATLDDGPLGDAALEHIDAGSVRAVSLRFESDRQVTRDGIVWRLRARPRELSLVLDHQHGQYDDAVITARRALEVSDGELVELSARAARAQALAERTARNLDRAALLL